MIKCKHCNKEITQSKHGRQKIYCDTKCKDKWHHYNSDVRKGNNARRNDRNRSNGYNKAWYLSKVEYNKARALKYYYENRDVILEQRRGNKGKADVVEEALIRIRSGRADINDAYDYMDCHLGFHSCEIENFIVEMLDDENT